MAEILTKHSKAKVSIQIPEAVATPKAELRNPLEWGKPYNIGPGTAMLKSLCGLFRIDRVTSQLSVGYTAWSLAPAGQGLNKRLGCAETADAAKALCEAER